MNRTLEQARALCILGWNIRCNRCGDYGATWCPNERPDWGAIALCDKHHKDLLEEYRRHEVALERLRAINYEQDAPCSCDLPHRDGCVNVERR